MSRITLYLWSRFVLIALFGSTVGFFGLFPPITCASPLITQEVTKLLTGDSRAGDQFGFALAMDGDTAVVGVPLYDAHGGSTLSVGTAYVFSRDPGDADNWGLVKKLVASDGEKSDNFGWAVAIDGDIIAVGAPFEDEFWDAAGAVYVYERNEGENDNWGEVDKLSPSDASESENFGWSVAVSGDRIVSTSPDGDGANPGAGSAYIFMRDSGPPASWTEEKKIFVEGGTVGDWSNAVVSIDDAVVVVGSPVDSLAGSGNGTAVVFERDEGGAGNWGQKVILAASDAAAQPAEADLSFGFAVAVDGDTIVVGADVNNENGSAYVFDRNTGTGAWEEKSILRPLDGFGPDSLGIGVDIDGDRVIAGALGVDDFGNNAGSAYVFDRDEGGSDAWGQVAKLIASDAAAADEFGVTVAVSGSTILVGAQRDDDNGGDSGSAYVFEVAGTTGSEGNRAGVSALLEDADDEVFNLGTAFTDLGDPNLTYSVRVNADSASPQSGPDLATPTIDNDADTLTLAFLPNGHGHANLTIRATSTGGDFFEATFLTEVESVNDQPTTSGLAPVDVTENAPDTVVDLSASFDDVEDGLLGSGSDRLSYTVQSNSNPDLFSAVTPTGSELTLAYGPGEFGSSVLTIRASDTGTPSLFNESDLNVDVSRDYTSWRIFNFGQSTLDTPALKATTWGDDANPDGDLFGNLIEYFMGLDPLLFDSDDTLIFELSENEARLIYLQALGLNDVSAAAEWSSDLLDWFGTNITTQSEDLGDQARLTSTFTLTGNEDVLFMRLLVTLPVP